MGKIRHNPNEQESLYLDIVRELSENIQPPDRPESAEEISLRAILYKEVVQNSLQMKIFLFLMQQNNPAKEDDDDHFFRTKK